MGKARNRKAFAYGESADACNGQQLLNRALVAGDFRSAALKSARQVCTLPNCMGKAFINPMVPHHRSAIEMASVALQETDNARIKEIAQMLCWREEWYPQG